MKKHNKMLLLELARIGMEHLPKNWSKEKVEECRTLLAWVKGGATGEWPTVTGSTRDDEGFRVQPKATKARVRKAKPEPVETASGDTTGVNV